MLGTGVDKDSAGNAFRDLCPAPGNNDVLFSTGAETRRGTTAVPGDLVNFCEDVEPTFFGVEVFPAMFSILEDLLKTLLLTASRIVLLDPRPVSDRLTSSSRSRNLSFSVRSSILLLSRL